MKSSQIIGSGTIRYLGIDTSTIAMPFAVFDDKELVDYGVYTTQGTFFEDKLHFQYNKIQDLIEEYDIDIVVLEDAFIGKNMYGAKSTMQMLGALRMGAYIKNATCFLVLASKWRKGIIKTRQKKSVKQQAIDYVNENYDLDLKYHKSKTKTDDDIAEAIIMVEGIVWGRYTFGDVRVFKS